MSKTTVTDATLVSKAAKSEHSTPLKLALFDSDGAPVTPLSGESNVAAFQSTFVGADVTALKVELNAFRQKLIDAGLMEAS